MSDPSVEVPLPFAVQQLLDKICVLHHLSPPPGVDVRRQLSSIGEEASIRILEMIHSVSTRIKCLDAYIRTMVKKYGTNPYADSIYHSPPKPSSCSPCSPSDINYNSPITKQFVNSPLFNSKGISPDIIAQWSNSSPIKRPRIPPSTGSEMASTTSSQLLLILAELEFRKFFLVLSYIGRNNLEDVISVGDANFIVEKTQVESMRDFELRIWTHFGQKHCEESDRAMHLDWDAGKTHLYHCYAFSDGGYCFKGPYLKGTRTHLQRAIGDDNVLIVKFEQGPDLSSSASSSSNWNTAYEKICQEGILVGQRRYHFFVFKDGGKVEKSKSHKKKNNPNSWDVKCYFVRRESLSPCDEKDPYIFYQKTVHAARCHFMHVHMVSSMVKYMARFSLILSQTIKLQVDLKYVFIEEIDDIPCHDENGVVRDEDGEDMIHTDGTGFISEELLQMCPKGFCDAKYMKDGNLESFLGDFNLAKNFSQVRVREACPREPPLLIQCRLFHEGRAVKGTLLLNRKLKGRRIQFRSSMVKVKEDPSLSRIETFDSLEVVAVSHKPRKANLSRNLILLLSIGGVPKEYFLGLLENTLEDTHNVYSNKRAALRVSLNNGDIDDSYTSAKMILAGVPLNEPCLQNRLSTLAGEERKGLGGGKLPISESFYLMGTADPTGVLNNNQVCVILENGQISGEVLVYRNPGLHFGDIHILNAIYVKALEDFVGNAKFAIFFSTKGRRSVASEIANGDLDGDKYWISRNPELLSYFKASDPWRRLYSTPNAFSRKPSNVSREELERELFKLLLDAKKQSNVAGMAANSWMALMDRLLILGDGSADEKHSITVKILELIDLYYDALDAPKTGKKVEVPSSLRAEKSPHYMEMGDSYHSTSVLGQIYDRAKEFKTEKLQIEGIWKLPFLNTRNIPDACMKKWKKNYDEYRTEMTSALKRSDESKNDLTNSVIKKYKQMVYGGAEFEESERNLDEIYDDALALYHVTYDFAMERRDVKKCYFAWRVAGSALCKYLSSGQEERSISCLPSVLRDVIN